MFFLGESVFLKKVQELVQYCVFFWLSSKFSEQLFLDNERIHSAITTGNHWLLPYCRTKYLVPPADYLNWMVQVELPSNLKFE